MKAVTLFKTGTHITDVTIQHKGEIAIGSGGTGGEYYIRIPPQERLKLLSALADASANSPPNEMSDELSDETILALLGELFGMGRRYESNYVLKKNGGYINLPKPASDPNYYQHDIHFMGWVIEEGSTL